ncbi:MAG: MFS transporter [Lactobacillaceae bacterium]|jgi:MFS family permease|nr:MFS transporter [Lactobacillaceae bacterium]
MHEFIHNKAYRGLALSTYVDNFGIAFFNIVFIIYAAQLPYKTLAVSLVSFATIFPTILQFLTGYFADRTQFKLRSMMWSKWVQAVLFILLAVMIQRDASLLSFIIFIIINILSDLMGEFSNGLEISLLKENVVPENLNSAISLSSAALNLITIAGQAIGATLIVVWHHNFTLVALLNAATFVLAYIILWAYRLKIKLPLVVKAGPNDETVDSDSKGNVKSKNGFIQHTIAVFKALQKIEGIIGILILFFLVNLLASSVMGLINLSLIDFKTMWLFGNYGATVAGSAIAFSSGTIAGALIQDRLNRLELPSLSCLVLICLAVLTGDFLLVHISIVLILSLFAVGYLFGKIGPIFSTFIITNIEQNVLASSVGVLNTMILVGAPLGQLIFLGTANISNDRNAWLIYMVGVTLVFIFAVGLDYYSHQFKKGDANV